MKKSILLLVTVFSVGVTADEMSIATADEVAELKSYCQEIADEEKVAPADVAQYVLKCVNEELNSEGYQAVTSVE